MLQAPLLQLLALWLRPAMVAVSQWCALLRELALPSELVELANPCRQSVEGQTLQE